LCPFSGEGLWVGAGLRLFSLLLSREGGGRERDQRSLSLRESVQVSLTESTSLGWKNKELRCNFSGVCEALPEQRKEPLYLALGWVDTKVMASSALRIFSASASGMVMVNSSSRAMHT
jgi:hypothetical protein